MLLKYLLIIMCVLVSGDVKVFAGSAEYSFEEQQCLLLGGICAKAQECGDKNRLQTNTTKVLCNAGSVCCYSIPSSTICVLNGGECFAKGKKCPDRLTVMTGVTDCEEGEKCCILVK